MSESTLMNFVTVDYATESDLEVSRFRWEENREKYLPQLMSKGLNRFTVLRIWNKEGVFRLGFWYEYKDPDAFAACKEIWGEIESQSKKGRLQKFLRTGVSFLKTTNLQIKKPKKSPKNGGGEGIRTPERNFFL